MLATKVEYQVQPSYADTNAENIRKVMQALQNIPIDGVNYAAFRKEDGNSFVHMAVFRNEEAQAKMTSLQEFKDFQAALKESKPLSPPAPAQLAVVGTSYAL